MSPILSPDTLDTISHSPDQTRRLASRLVSLLEGGETICLKGPLGAGKTTFAQGVGQGLGIEEPIISPTFTLIREYGPVDDYPAMYHIDFYRLESLEELHTLGLDDYFYSDGVCVVEWPERAEMLLPQERLWIEMRTVNDTKRGLLIRADGDRYRQLLRAFKKLVYGL
ncbi:MAG: tRNA (adenosine(37)-N6)-threonylcarbamoyltransferase complex ATPase subunit type 1 TsaE [Anaerolineae bacterium]